jgi:hypothetical protein
MSYEKGFSSGNALVGKMPDSSAENISLDIDWTSQPHGHVVNGPIIKRPDDLSLRGMMGTLSGGDSYTVTSTSPLGDAASKPGERIRLASSSPSRRQARALLYLGLMGSCTLVLISCSDFRKNPNRTRSKRPNLCHLDKRCSRPCQRPWVFP